MMKFTQVPTDTFKKIQLNAGILLSDFSPATGAVDVSNIIAATSGGNSFACTPTFKDFGADIDNVPDNTKELLKIDFWDVSLSGSMVSFDGKGAVRLLGAADLDGDKVTPRSTVKDEDFEDIWWVGDYSDDNSQSTGGFIAIKVINALSTGGLKITSTDKGKGKFDYEFKGHYSLEDIDQVPCEIYVHQGTA